MACAGQLAPVVDAGQDANNTQIESVGTSWQSMQGQDVDKTHNEEAAAPSDASEMSSDAANTDDAQASSGSLSERVDRISQQVANITRMNVPQQVADMQQKMAELQGQIEVAQRDLKMLSQQQARLYQDLSQRLSQLKGGDKTMTSAAPVSDQSKAVVAKATDVTSYQNAFKLLSSKQFDKAADAFTVYLKDYSKGQFAANAHYWLGEIAMQKKAYGDAYAQFQLLIAQYPDSNKVADAKLKVAIIHGIKGKKDLAKIEFKQIEKEYPNSTAAQLASIQLQKLGS